MANEQHIEWLLEGVEAWNARREREDFVPNLAGVNLYKKFQEAEKLDSNGQIPLSGINLSSCADPSKADPISADLTDVYPSRANFTGGTNLPSAALGDAQLDWCLSWQRRPLWCRPLWCRSFQCQPLQHRPFQCLPNRCRSFQCLPNRRGSFQCGSFQCRSFQCRSFQCGSFQCGSSHSQPHRHKSHAITALESETVWVNPQTPE